MASHPNLMYCTGIFGILLLSLGLVMIPSEDWFVENVLPSSILKPNTMIEELWRKPPAEVPTHVYVFNWTNPEDIHNMSTKPKFEQLGPYKYMQNLEKVDVIWNNNNTVTFKQVRTWRFDEESPNGDLSDSVTAINAVTMAGAYKIRFWDYWTKLSISTLFSSTSPDIAMTRTVDELLFAGHDDPIMDMFKYLPFLAPEVPRFDKFGWFRMRNGSADFDGVFNMANGIDGHYDILNWNYQQDVPCFEGSCATIHGSGGELFPSKLSRDHIGVFYADICRHLELEYEEDVFIEGILGYKYTVGKKVLDNGTLVPENACYCTGECIPSGVLNASECKYGLPTFISLPNFYSADPVYLDAMEGMHPDREKHEAYIILEPNTGALLKAVLRLQLNTLLRPVENIAIYENVPEVFFPLLWVQQEMEIPKHLVPLLKLLLKVPIIYSAVSSILIVIGLFLLLFTLYRPMYGYVYHKLKQTPSKHLNPEEVPL